MVTDIRGDTLNNPKPMCILSNLFPSESFTTKPQVERDSLSGKSDICPACRPLVHSLSTGWVLDTWVIELGKVEVTKVTTMQIVLRLEGRRQALNKS